MDVPGRDLLKDLQNLIIRPVADRMNHHLQAGTVGVQDALEHRTFWKHLVARQTAGLRGVRVGLEKKRFRGAKAAIAEPLQSADAQHVAAERGAHAGLAEPFPLRERRYRVDARLDLAAAQ